MSRPRIACFHGGGSSAAIFNVQSYQVQAQLADAFEFVFFEGPFECAAGPGVLPSFQPEEYGPYRSWFWRGRDMSQPELEILDGRGEDNSGELGLQRVYRLLKESGPGGLWIGCMGFSQGTRVVGGLLLEQQRRKEEGLPSEFEFKFGLLCMGSSAPMTSEDTKYSKKISIPTLHLHGTKDAHFENGKRQMESYFDENTRAACDIDYHHAMPWNKNDVAKMVGSFRKLLVDHGLAPQDIW